ncbi:DUF4188 domain-containing protein [Bacillus daqingensis]|uniref:DUF4188 domain-containing protein n=1 Tax=Bacillus daqingensis TaxID=872396 RepID=A0ABV9NUM6_9BACI
MKQIYAPPHTVLPDKPLTVFIIGMRVNKPLSVKNWFPVFKAMGPMIKELYENKDSGFYSLETMFGWKSIHLVQYWESEEKLFAYAHEDRHRKAWKTFMQLARRSTAAGIYHETYAVESYEAIYANMPKFGLAKAAGHVPVTAETRQAAARMRASREQKAE